MRTAPTLDAAPGAVLATVWDFPLEPFPDPGPSSPSSRTTPSPDPAPGAGRPPDRSPGPGPSSRSEPEDHPSPDPVPFQLLPPCPFAGPSRKRRKRAKGGRPPDRSPGPEGGMRTAPTLDAVPGASQTPFREQARPRARPRPPGPSRSKPGPGPGPGSAFSRRSEGPPTLAIHEYAVRSYTTTTYGDSDQKEERFRTSRAAKYQLREKGTWPYSIVPRCHKCGRVPAWRKDGEGSRREVPGINITEEDVRAYWSGIMACGAIWSCPVCSAKIRHQRALEANEAMKNWVSQRKLCRRSVVFLTLTMPHDSTDDLPCLIGTIKHAFRKLFNGRPWRRDRERFRIRAWVRVWDITHGKNGWHPHLHIALFVEGNPTPEELTALEDEWYRRWAEAVVEKGFRAPSREHGIHLEKARDTEQVSAYLMKIEGEESGVPLAQELTRGDLKTGKGRTPFGILQDFIDTGDLQDLALFKAYERATKGQHFSRWSKGAKELLGIQDLSDQELVEKEVGGTLVYTPTPDEFHAVVRTPGGLAKALRIAETEGKEAVQAYLAGLVPGWKRTRKKVWKEAKKKHRAAAAKR